MAIAHLEPIENPAYRLRVGPDDWTFGQPYEVGLVAEDMGGGVVSISLLDKPLVPTHWRAITTVLAGAGFERITFDRHRADGQVEAREVELKK